MKGGRTAVCRMESLRRGGICGHRQTSKHIGLGIPLQDWRFLLRASNDILPWEAPPRIDAVFFQGKLGTMRFEELTVSCIVQASSFNMSFVRPPLWHRLRGLKSDQLCAIPSWVTLLMCPPTSRLLSLHCMLYRLKYGLGKWSSARSSMVI